MSKVYFASDHAGFPMKGELAAFVASLGYEVEDVGPFILDEGDDYPDFIAPCAKKVADTADSFGIILGGSGQGEAMAANRIKGVRASVFYGGSLELVRLAREHNDANVLSLGARFLSVDEATEAVRLFLFTSFSGEESHARRLAKF
jgi:ribose 5-phosphate isomerase B